MGNVGEGPTPHPEAIERQLSWGPVVRGLRWVGGVDTAFLLHEPGADIDAWGSLSEQLASQLAIEVIAFDLPGHGLSDDPWEPALLPALLRSLLGITPVPRRRFVIAAGAPAFAALGVAAGPGLAGLVCLSPEDSGDGSIPPRSPAVPKLMVAGSLAGNDLDTARRLATSCGGWAIVTSLPVADRGTALLASAWGGRIREEIGAFLRDCQRRPPARTSGLGPGSPLYR